jgi:outer membrane protein assembly factor BamD
MLWLRDRLAICSLAALILIACPAPLSAQQTGKSSAQPDKILYDRGLTFIQKKHYEEARLTLQTLVNTYESSEYLPQAQLAIADSWFKQGGTRAFNRAEQDCKLLIQQFPGSPEAAQATELLRKIAEINAKQQSSAK